MYPKFSTDDFMRRRGFSAKSWPPRSIGLCRGMLLLFLFPLILLFTRQPMATSRRRSLFLTQSARSLLLAAVVVSVFVSAKGNPEVRFKTWSAENGLPQNSV